MKNRFATSALVGALMTALAACSGSSSSSPGSTTPNQIEKPPAPEAQAATQTPTPAEDFIAECRKNLESAKFQLTSIVATEGERTKESFLVPMDRMFVTVEQSMGNAGVTSNLHPDKAMRDAAQVCEQEVSTFLTNLSLNKELYKAYGDIDKSKLDAIEVRLVDKALLDYRRAGVDKDEATRKRLREISEEIVREGQNFQANIVKDVRSIELSSVDELAGLPQDYIDNHQPNEEGKIVITTDYPDYRPFILYADSGERREELYKQFKSRGSENNEEVLRKLLTLRAEKAKILGYDNWADYLTEDKMIGSGQNAAEFLERVNKIAQRRARRDYQELLSWKKRNLNKKARAVADWEKEYISNKVRQERYSYDVQTVRPYFSYTAVEDGLLAVTSKMYDIQYKLVTDKKVWHEDVKIYDVVRGEEKLGRIYLDMHPRAGKYQHAAQATLRSGVKGVQLPEGVLMCNFPSPKNGTALMEHQQVETMFHEFGHLMHHILGGQREWIGNSGVATEWDFVEAPSQMFEEWAWDHAILSSFAKHHESGEPIPADLVKKMRKADRFGIGTDTVQQLFYASVSLNFHQTDPKSLNMDKKVKELQKQYTPFAFVEGTKFHTSFGHLEGYSALYYTYMWSLVIAKDLLSPFKKHGLMNTEWTHRYRDRILVPGGSKDAADLVKDFLERPYNFKAFEAYIQK